MKKPGFFYETTDVWDTDIYGTYTPAYISGFITKTLDTLPVDEKTQILNAGSGGKEYYSKGEQYHIDLAASKLSGIKNAVVGNLTNMPYPEGYFDIVLMAGCVLSYCEADKAIRELARVLKPGGYLVVDYERSGSAVLPFFLRNRDVFQAKYKYMGKPHRSYLFQINIPCAFSMKTTFMYYNPCVSIRFMHFGTRFHSFSSGSFIQRT